MTLTMKVVICLLWLTPRHQARRIADPEERQFFGPDGDVGGGSIGEKQVPDIGLSDGDDSEGVAQETEGLGLGLLELGCQIDFTENRTKEEERAEARSLAENRALVLALSGSSVPEEDVSAAASRALTACSEHRSFIRRWIEAPNLTIAGSVAFFSVTMGPNYTQLLQSIQDTVDSVIYNSAEPVYTDSFEPLYTLTVRARLTSLSALATAGFLGLGAFAINGPTLVMVPSSSAASLVPMLMALQGFTQLTSLTESMVEALLGLADNHPICCCPSEDSVNETESGLHCATVANTGTLASICPMDWHRRADACEAPMVQVFSDTSTVEACECRDWAECGSNQYHLGHAWCYVSGPGSCGTRHGATQRWDYCLYDGSRLNQEFGAGSNASLDDVAFYLPNRNLRSAIAGGVFGTVVDTFNALAVGRLRTNETSSEMQCFASAPEESLRGCAKRCSQDNAPTADTMNGRATTSHRCVGFAYNRQQHQCLRLPEFIVDAQFPYLDEDTGQGWQHFISKYTEVGDNEVCNRSTINEIGEAGYEIVQDRNNGHIFVQCLGNDNLQKISCRSRECRDRGTWCMVPNGCWSGLWWFLGGCWQLSAEKAFQCAGEHGAIPGAHQFVDYYDVSNSMDRCRIAARTKFIKMFIAGPIIVLIGHLAVVNIGGLLANAAYNVFRTSTMWLVSTLWGFASQTFIFMVNLLSWLPNSVWGFLLGTAMVGIGAILTTNCRPSWGAIRDNTQDAVTTGAAIALVPAAAILLVPAIATMVGVSALTSSSVDVISGFMGFGNKIPECCCQFRNNTRGEEVKSCAMFSPKYGSDPECPLEWTSVADGCDIPELIVYSEHQSLQGCQCRNYTDCHHNTPREGHAWCHSQGAQAQACGYMGVVGGRWDYCMFTGIANFTNATELLARDFDLDHFIPNRFNRFDLFGSGNPLTLGTYTDQVRHLTLAKPHGWLGEHQCFVALPKETLGACAAACKLDGATSAGNHSYRCAAFAWNGEMKLCVRLPAFAADAKFTPFMKKWGGPGWQNYINRYYGALGGQGCPANTLLALRNSGFAVARNKHNGRIYVRCWDDNDAERTQKASCLESDCGPGQPWCQVKNHCGAIFNRCRGLPEPSLTCTLPPDNALN